MLAMVITVIVVGLAVVVAPCNFHSTAKDAVDAVLIQLVVVALNLIVDNGPLRFIVHVVGLVTAFFFETFIIRLTPQYPDWQGTLCLWSLLNTLNIFAYALFSLCEIM